MPDELDAIISRCLAKDRTQRYANVAELATALAPLGPPNATRSSERIARILRTSGSLSSSESSLPPTVLATTGNVVTLKAAQDVLQPRQSSRSVWLPVSLLLAAAAAFWVFRRPAPAIEHAAEPPAVPAAAAAPTVTTPPLVAEQTVTPAPVTVPVIESAAPSNSAHAKPARPEPAVRSVVAAAAPAVNVAKLPAPNSVPAPAESKPAAPRAGDPLEDRR